MLLLYVGIVVVIAFLTVSSIPGAYGTILDIVFGRVFMDGNHMPTIAEPAFPFGNVIQMVETPDKYLQNHLKSAKKYGAAFGWTFFDAVINMETPEYLKIVGSLDVSIKKSTRVLDRIMPVWKQLFGNGLFMVGSNDWKRMHKIAIRGMGSNKMRFYLPAVIKCAKNVIYKLESERKVYEEKGTKSFIVDCADLFVDYATEAIMTVGFGESLAEDEIRRLGKKFAHVTDIGTLPLYMMRSYWMLPLPSNIQLKRDIAELHKVGRELTRKFRKGLNSSDFSHNPKQTGSLLEALCTASDGSETFTEEECVHNIYSFIGAGIDTTSTALTHCAVMLALHPLIQQKIREEISSDDDEEIDMDKSLNAYPQLSAFIKETLRLFPPVIGVPGRYITKELKIGPFTLHPGSVVAANSLSCGRNEKFWGPDAREFRPERFLETKEGRTKDGIGVDITNTMGHRFTSFGFGVRSCIGKSLSVMEIKAVLTKILRKFEISNPHGDKLNMKDSHFNVTVAFCKTKADLAKLTFTPV
ncbi:hypothetical protein AAMO2058_000056400 [Amorphochlora amoebiformis]|mmetsp:Transcript_10010/g.15809  ORF Transcript_10010/g.15809 Transcript_10010/m.15809 type:complete len:526 (-) Transcript_10010:374-1951(-)